MTFNNKTVLITGASSGIGKAVGEKLLQINCNLILTARRNDIIENWVNKLENKKANILILKNDVINKSNVAQTFAKITEEFGNIDVAILNSGIGKNVTTQNFSSQIAEDIINTIFWALFIGLSNYYPI